MEGKNLGRFNIIIFIVLYFLVVGFISTIFSNQDVPSESEFKSKMTKNIGEGVPKEVKINNPLTLLSDIVSIVGNGLSIFVKGLTFDIPEVPLVIRLFLQVPIIVLLCVLIIDLILELIPG